MLKWLKQRVSRHVADRLLPATLPRPGARARLSRWAYAHASVAGQNAAVIRQLEDARWQQRMELMALAGGEPTRSSVPWPAFNTFGYSRMRGMRALPKPTPLNLRVLSQSPPAMRCIEKIKSMVVPLDWKCQVTGLARGNQPTAGQQRRIDQVQRSMARPNADGDTWETFLGQVIEEICVGGAGAIEVQPWPGNTQTPFRLWAVDGLSIQINWNWISDDAAHADNAIRYVQTFPYGNTNQYTSAAPIGKQFLDQELIYARFRPRANTPFGFGPLESAFQGINAWLGAMDARERMESNEIPPFGLALGEGATDADAAAARDFWIDAVEGQGEIPFFAGGKNPTVLPFRRDNDAGKNQWPEMLLRAIALPFGLPPQVMGIERDVNRTNADVMASDEFTSAALPMIHVVQDALTLGVLHKVLEWDDLEIVAVISQGDPLKQAQAVEILVSANVITIDEGREKLGLDDMPDGKGTVTQAEHVAAQQPQMPALGDHPGDRISQEPGTPGTPPLGKPPAPGAKLPGKQKPAKPGQQAPTKAAPDKTVTAMVGDIRAQVLEAIQAGRDDEALVTVDVPDRDVAYQIRRVLSEAE